MWNVIKMILQYFHLKYILPLGDDGLHKNKNGNKDNDDDNDNDKDNCINDDDKNNDDITIDKHNSKSKSKQRRCIKTIAAPGLITLLDTALYRAHEGQLTATVSSANATLVALIQFKSHAKSLLHFCYSELSPVSLTTLGYAHSHSRSRSHAHANKHSDSTPLSSTPSSSKVQLIQRRKRHLESVSVLISFASYCIESANDAIERLRTDKLSKSANYEPMSQIDYQKENSIHSHIHSHSHSHGAGSTCNIHSDGTTNDLNDNDHPSSTGAANSYGHDNSASHTLPLSPTQSLSSPLAATPSSPQATTTTTTKSKSKGMTSASRSTSMSTSTVSSPPSGAATTSVNATTAASRDAQNKRLFVEEGIISSKYNHWNEVGLRLRYLQHQRKESGFGAGLSSYFQNNFTSTSSSSSTSTTLRKKDCWESESLFCPDYVWAEDSMLQCQRMVRSIMKHDAIELLIDILHSGNSSTNSDNNNSAGINRGSSTSNSSSTASSGGGGGGGGGSSGGNTITPTSNISAFAGIHTSSTSGGTTNLSPSGYSHGIHSLLPLLFDNENDTNNNRQQRRRRQHNAKLGNKLLLLLSNMMTLLKHDLPLRIHQFRCGIESDVNVTKRLYLLKNECRAPFRAFLEGHVNVQRAPDLELVDSYVELHNNVEEDKNGSNDRGQPTSLKEKKKIAERKIQDCIGNIRFQEALMIEYKCETLEVEMGMVLLPFCNLARTLLEGKGAFHLIEIPGVLPAEEVLLLQELLRRLKSILCKKPDENTSTGIRPLLQDLQGIPRDSSFLSSEIFVFGQFSGRISTEEAINKRLDKLCSQLQYIYDIAKTKGGFGVDKKEFGGLPAAIRACTNAGLDTNKFRTMFKEWYSLCRQQHTLSSGKNNEDRDQTKKEGKEKEEKATRNNDDKNDVTTMTFEELAEEMRKAEIEVSIAMAPKQALFVVQQRIDQIEKDRNRRFEILQEMLEEICLREMDFHLELKIPKKDVVLELPQINSVSGIFDPLLEMMGEI